MIITTHAQLSELLYTSEISTLGPEFDEFLKANTDSEGTRTINDLVGQGILIQGELLAEAKAAYGPVLGVDHGYAFARDPFGDIGACFLVKGEGEICASWIKGQNSALYE